MYAAISRSASSRFVKAFIHFLWHPFAFKAPEEPFHRRVIPTIATAANTLLNRHVIEQNNAQNKFNLHNLKAPQGGHLVDSPLRLSSILKSQNRFRIGFFSYFLVLPFLLYIPKIKKLMSKIGYKKPDYRFTLILLLVFLLSFVIALFSSEKVKVSLVETREMLYAFFIMLYVIFYLWREKQNRA